MLKKHYNSQSLPDHIRDQELQVSMH